MGISCSTIRSGRRTRTGTEPCMRGKVEPLFPLLVGK